MSGYLCDLIGNRVIYGVQPATDDPISTAQREQREAAARYIEDSHPMAELGMGDWFAEEFLIEQEARDARIQCV